MALLACAAVAFDTTVLCNASFVKKKKRSELVNNKENGKRREPNVTSSLGRGRRWMEMPSFGRSDDLSSLDYVAYNHLIGWTWLGLTTWRWHLTSSVILWTKQ
eukprot:scaffold8828_cov204-Amphora_coffeaeformis.AAC.15